MNLFPDIDVTIGQKRKAALGVCYKTGWDGGVAEGENPIPLDTQTDEQLQSGFNAGIVDIVKTLYKRYKHQADISDLTEPEF